MNSIDIFPWDENFNTGLPKVDEQHRRLVQLLNLLASHVAFSAEPKVLDQIFDELAEYTVYHFDTEELIWHEHLAGDPAEAEHLSIHRSFVQEVSRLKASQESKPLTEVAEETLGFLARWLASHILESDRYLAYVVLARKEGLLLETAKNQAKEQMGGATRALINIILSIYSTLSANTLRLMRELAAHRVAETELKQARDQLHQRAGYQRAVLDNFPFMVWLKDEESRFLAVNKPFAEACGQTAADDLVGKTDLDIWPRDLAERYRTDDREVLSTGKPKIVEELVEERGRHVWNETFKSPVKLDDKVVGTVGFARDITDRKEIEQNAAKAYALLHEAVSHVAVGFTLYDELDRIITCNETYLEFYRTSRDLIVPGATFEEIVRKGAERGQYKEAVGHIDEWVRERVRKHQAADGSQLEQHLDDGRWLLIVEYRTPSGYIVGNRIDITARKQAEEALRKTSLYARSLIEASLDPLVTISPTGKITDVNQATETVTGKTREELIGTDFSSYFTEPEQAHAGYTKVFSDGKVTDYPLVIRHASGRVTDVLYNATTYRNAAGEVEGVFAAARDVSAQKLAEAALRESETKLRTVADNTYDWEYWQAPDNHFIYMSPSCERITGYTENEYLADPDLMQRILDPRDMHLYADHLHEIDTKDLCEIEFRIKTKYGETRWIAHNCRPVYDTTGNYLGRRASNRDVTALKDSELQYRTIIQTAQDGFLIVDTNTRFIDVNDAYCRMVGYDREEILKMKVADIEAIEDAEEARRHTEEMYRTGHVKFETRHRCRDNSIIDVEVTAQQMNLYGGVLVTFIRDISARKQAECFLAAERQRLNDYSESSADWFWEMDADLRFSYFSDNFESKYGLSPTAVLGKTRKELVVQNSLNNVSQLEAHLALLQQHQPFREFEYRLRDSARQIRWISVSGVPVHDLKGEFAGYRGIGRIITERKQMEEELKRHRTELEVLVDERTRELTKAKQAAEAANVAKSAFLANMSHEMRTPLHQVAGLASLLRREPLTPKQTDRMNMMDTSLHHLTGIIDTILELTRLEAKQFELTEVSIAPESIVRKAVETVQSLADAKQLPIIIETEPIPSGLLGDDHHISMALNNYLTNAIRFTSDGCVTVRAKLVEEDTASALLRIEVEDTGIGIAPEDQARLFNIFEQVDNSSTRKYGGLGAGLAMTKKIAILMGGDAGCESCPGAGSLFWLTVRLKKG